MLEDGHASEVRTCDLWHDELTSRLQDLLLWGRGAPCTLLASPCPSHEVVSLASLRRKVHRRCIGLIVGPGARYLVALLLHRRL